MTALPKVLIDLKTLLAAPSRQLLGAAFILEFRLTELGYSAAWLFGAITVFQAWVSTGCGGPSSRQVLGGSSPRSITAIASFSARRNCTMPPKIWNQATGVSRVASSA